MHKIGLKLTIAQHGEIQLSRIQVNDGNFRNDPQPTNPPTRQVHEMLSHLKNNVEKPSCSPIKVLFLYLKVIKLHIKESSFSTCQQLSITMIVHTAN